MSNKLGAFLNESQRTVTKGRYEMKRNWFVVSLMCLFLVGCASTGRFPHETGTRVDLSRKNYCIVKTNAVGESAGFSLLGFIPLSVPRYTEAMSDLYSKAGLEAGKAQALANVTQEKSSTYLILFSIPKLTVRADIVEFLDEK